MRDIILRVGVIFLFAVSPSVLNLVGLGYTNGNPILGIHVSSYLLVLAAGWPILANVASGQNFVGLRFPAASIYTLAVSAVLMPILVVKGDFGFRMAVLVVTYATPALILFLLKNAEEKTLRHISLFITSFLVVNSTIGIFEYVSGQRIIPFTVGLETITFDPRPCALLSHPLYNALVTGAFLLSLLIRAVRRGISPLTAVGIGFFTVSMFTFGGRTALVAVFAIFALYTVYQACVAVFTMRANKAVIRTSIIIAVLAIAAPVVLASPIAAVMLDRFSNSASSDESRFVAFSMLNSLSQSELLSGIDTTTQAALQAQLGSTRGIEISWIALIISFGLPAAIALIIGMISLLWSSAGRSRDLLFLLLYFVVVTFGSLSIGSRSLLISQMMVIMICGPLATFEAQRTGKGASGRRYKVQRRRVARPPGGEPVEASA